jgi:hypothetical protein
MPAAEKRFPPGEQYLAWEREADFKSEYLRGEIYAMSGASLEHNTIASNLNGALWNQLKGRPCRVLGSDMRVQVEAADAYFYPDISGLCGEFDFHDDRKDAYKNPQFVIEILSDSTESYDRGKKFFHYQTLQKCTRCKKNLPRRPGKLRCLMKNLISKASNCTAARLFSVFSDQSALSTSFCPLFSASGQATGSFNDPHLKNKMKLTQKLY